MPNELSSAPNRATPQRHESWHRSTHLFFAAGMAILISILVASYMQASSGLDAMKQFAISSQHMSHLDQLHLLFLEMQSTARGYALTREPSYLDSYRETVEKIHDSLQIVEQDYQDELRPEAKDLIKKAHVMATRMDIMIGHLEHGEPPDKAGFEQGSLEMNDFKRQHDRMKSEMLSRNMNHIADSISRFKSARTTSVLLAIASLLLLVTAISQKQKKQKLQDKLHEILEAENERLELEVRHRTEELTSLATYLTNVRETEKLDLARELHDELGALLTAAKLDADWIERTLLPESHSLVAQRLSRLRQSLIGGITLKRRITNNLQPALLYDLGLIEALRVLIEEFRGGEETIEIQAELPETEPELPEAVSLSLFRIVQEGLTNIRTYARARHVHVSLRITPTNIELSIEDDGVGFDIDSPKIARHGLAGIKHRVFTHGGVLDIRTAPGAGVKLRAVLPA